MTQYTPIQAKILWREGNDMTLYYAPENGQNAQITRTGTTPIDLGEYVLCTIHDTPAPEPPFADVVTALEAQAVAIEKVAVALDAISRTLNSSLR